MSNSLFPITKILKISLSKKIKFLSRAIFFSKNYDSIFKILNQDKFKTIIETNPNIYLKPLRAYLFCNIKTAEKFDYLESHYKFLEEKFPKKTIDKIYGSDDTLIYENKLSQNHHIELFLCMINSLGKEGELTLLLKLNSNDIYSVQFSFYKDSLIICGIQSRSTTTTEELKELTKKMHGLRPRNLMFFAIRQICEAFFIKEIKAIDSSNHVANCSRVKNTGKFKADYDTYWEEERATKDGDFYIIPLIEQRKTMEEISSNKRSMYKKRFELLDNMKDIIKENLTNLISR